MKTADLTPQASAITDAIFETFRLHGDLITLGDRMSAPFGLTSARWQILGTVVLSPTEVTVPQIARHLGLSRQAVQRVANDLEQAGLIRFDENPHHKRAKLVRLTTAGERAYQDADRTFADWANDVGAVFTVAELLKSINVMQRLNALCSNYLEDSAERELELA